MPGEPVQPVEIGFGVPVTGLYLREDVEMKCNFMVTRFVRKTLKDALAQLVARLSVRAQLTEVSNQNRRLTYDPMGQQQFQPPLSPPLTAPMGSPHSGNFQMAYGGHSGQPSPSFQKPSPQQPQYAQYNPATYAAAEVDAVGQRSPKPPQQGPGRIQGPSATGMGYQAGPVPVELE